MFRHWAIVRFSLKYLGFNTIHITLVCLQRWRDLHIIIVGRQCARARLKLKELKTKTLKSMSAGEAGWGGCKVGGYSPQCWYRKKACFLPFSVGSACVGLSVIAVVRSVPCGWIKLCQRTVDVWLLNVCKNELLLWKGVLCCRYF
jgi:hypothetical protein